MPVQIEAPTEAQKERSAASRLAGQMKPGQSETHHRNLLLLEGIAEKRIDEVLAQAKQLQKVQLQRSQKPLKVRALIQIFIGCFAFLIAIICIIFVLPDLAYSFDNGVFWMIGMMFLLASFGWVSLRQGLKLRKELREERGEATKPDTT